MLRKEDYMKNIKIGIPRALLYYQYKDLWFTFFNELKCPIIVSDKTNKETIKEGSKYLIDESCLSMKIYIGQVSNLVERVDYLLVPRLIHLKRKEKLCTNFSALYDLVHNIFPEVKILNYNIDTKKCLFPFVEFIKMGRKVEHNLFKVVIAYIKAIRFEKRNRHKKIIKQRHLLENNNLKILLVGHPYNLYDKLIGEPIDRFLKKNNVNVIYSDLYDKKRLKKEYKKISTSIYWTYSKELMGSIIHYKDKVDGIIMITTFPCGVDSLTNEMCLRKVKDTPITNIVIDDLDSEAGLITRLESFIDIIKERKNNQ
jgi:predicted nucleotide-binding protein (sugar kinase/HSP70/actin superfamily)